MVDTFPSIRMKLSLLKVSSLAGAMYLSWLGALAPCSLGRTMPRSISARQLASIINCQP